MRIAALDLGTNSFHLLVADVQPDGHFEALARDKAMIRLGDVVSRHGRVTDAAADVAVATVRRFKLLADAAGATELHTCATSAIRQAANGDALVDRIRTETGIRVEVISGLREAELIFGAIRASVLLEPAPALCFDLGGGSVEIMVGDASGLRWATSENLGVGRLTAEYVTSDPISKDDRRRLRAHIVDVLSPVADEVAAFEPKLCVGSSGTLEDIAHMVAARRKADVPVSLNQLTFDRDEFLPLHKQILLTPAAERLRLEGLEARRVDLIAAGSIFLETSMELFGFDELTVSEWALREGIVLDAIRRHDPADWSDDPRAIRRAPSKASPVGATGTSSTLARSPGSRSSCSTARRSCTSSAPRTGSSSSTAPSCTTSGSTSPPPATTSTVRTWCRTGGCAASRPRTSSCSRRSPAGTCAAIQEPAWSSSSWTRTASAG